MLTEGLFFSQCCPKLCRKNLGDSRIPPTLYEEGEDEREGEEGGGGEERRERTGLARGPTNERDAADG
jgi:hypothetical protein